MSTYDNIQLRLRLLTKEIDDTLLNYNYRSTSPDMSHHHREHFDGAVRKNLRSTISSTGGVELLGRQVTSQHEYPAQHDLLPTSYYPSQNNLNSNTSHQLLPKEVSKKDLIEGTPNDFVNYATNDITQQGSRYSLARHSVASSALGRQDVGQSGSISTMQIIDQSEPSGNARIGVLPQKPIEPSLKRTEPDNIVTPQLVDEALRVTLRRERLEEERSLAHLRLERERLEKEIDAALKERNLIQTQPPIQSLALEDSERILNKELQVRTLSPPRMIVHQNPILGSRLVRQVSEQNPSPAVIEAPEMTRTLLCDVPIMIVPSDDGPSVSAKLLLYQPHSKEGTDCVLIPSSPNIMPLSLVDAKADIRLLLPFATFGHYGLRGRIVTGHAAREALISQGCMSFAACERNRHLRVYCTWRDEDGGDLMCIWQCLNVSHFALVVSLIGGEGKKGVLRRGKVLWWVALSLLRLSQKGIVAMSQARTFNMGAHRRRTEGLRSYQSESKVVPNSQTDQHPKRSPSIRKLRKVIVYPSSGSSALPSPSQREYPLHQSTAPPSPKTDLLRATTPISSSTVKVRGPPQHLRKKTQQTSTAPHAQVGPRFSPPVPSYSQLQLYSQANLYHY